MSIITLACEFGNDWICIERGVSRDSFYSHQDLQTIYLIQVIPFCEWYKHIMPGSNGKAFHNCVYYQTNQNIGLLESRKVMVPPINMVQVINEKKNNKNINT